MKKKLQKKEVYISIIKVLMIIILISILISIIPKFVNRNKLLKDFENSTLQFARNNKKTVFSINKIVFFSSSDSKNKTSSATNFTIENLYAFTDIAILINNNSENNTLENTLKSVKISNVNYKNVPLEGQPNLYYKSINNFAKSELDEKKIIENELDFEVTSENEADLNNPVLYNNCANPITLSYINQNIKTDYTILDTQNPITYDGTLLKRCGVTLTSIKTSLSFDIDIENNENQKFRTTLYIDIPYEDEEKSVYNGNYVLKQDTNYIFYRYE